MRIQTSRVFCNVIRPQFELRLHKRVYQGLSWRVFVDFRCGCLRYADIFLQLRNAVASPQVLFSSRFDYLTVMDFDLPLTPLSSSRQNLRSPLSRAKYSSTSPNKENMDESFYDTVPEFPPSSPFDADVDLTIRSPQKQQSPMKPSSPRKPLAESTVAQSPMGSPLRDNEGLTTAIQALEHDNDLAQDIGGSDDRDYHIRSSTGFNPDETCYSDFSIVPPADMTAFARLGLPSAENSPTKVYHVVESPRTPRSSRPTTPGTARPMIDRNGSPSPSPRRIKEMSGDATTQLLEFTEQMNFSSHYNSRSPTRGQSSPNKLKNHLDRSRSPAKDGQKPKTPSEGCS